MLITLFIILQLWSRIEQCVQYSVHLPIGLQHGMEALRTFPGFQDFSQSCRNPQIFYNFLLRLFNRLFRPGFLVIVFEGKILKNVDINIL